MNLSEIMLVQESFAHVAPNAVKVADLFYARLFQLDPALRVMFPNDMGEQKKKLMTMLTVAVRGLTRLEQIVPAVEELARRHAGYGVQPQHYETVGSALLWTLEKALGDAFTPDVRAAWAATYTLLATTMQNATADAAVLA